MVSEKKPAGSTNLLPVILIIAGVLVLIANFGWITFDSLLGLLQLWPLVVIAFGVDILLAGRYRLAIILLMLLAAGLFYTGVVKLPGLAPAQTQHIERSLAGAQTARIQIESGVNELRIQDLEDSQQLLSGKIQTRRGETLLENYQMNGSVVLYELSTKSQRTMNIGGRHLWDISLTTRLPLELNISTGVGRSDLNLRRLNLSRLEINSGVGETTVTLPASGRYEAEFSAGVGAATITLPANLAARIELSRGVGAVSVNGSFIREGDRYTSANYETASNRVDLSVSGGVGAIKITTSAE